VKEWVKYIITFTIYFVLVSFWFVYIDWGPYSGWGDEIFDFLLYIVPPIISIYFVYRLLKQNKKLHRLCISIAAVTLNSLLMVIIGYQLTLLLHFIFPGNWDIQYLFGMMIFFLLNLTLAILSNKYIKILK
jgi:hypothetical protein